jgi:hypothetical protein
VEGWCSVGELTRWGFTHAPVVMANGILREQAPPPLDAHTGVDAVVVSTDNALT